VGASPCKRISSHANHADTQLDGYKEPNLAEDLAEIGDRAVHGEGVGRSHWPAPRLLFWPDQGLGYGSDEQPTDGGGVLHQAIARGGPARLAPSVPTRTNRPVWQ
jgi:hypothetical protein